MRHMLVIGIGAGNPDYLTVQAIKALNRTDVFFVVDKGQEKDGLAALRREILSQHVIGKDYRVVEIEEPARDRGSAAYRDAVEAWRSQRADRYEAAIRDHLADGECGALLVWGDPSLYDSSLAILDEILARGALHLTTEVIPGISSVQALAAGHRVTLNRVGEAIQVTTGRKLRGGLPTDAENVVVMLDADCTFAQVTEANVTIYWGAYVGTPDEILISGRLGDVAEEIQRVRAEARERHGWIMDTYLLRQNDL
ncbi:MAG: precorrin-6A synthase (deacetylating) [Chloroflexota bacterium]